MSAHILILDDDSDILEMLRLVLEQEGGYRVTLAQMLLEQIEDVERLGPDLILLDLQFGQRQLGWDFLQRLKLYRGTMRIPVVICTAALHDVREQEDMLRQKGVPVLYKPFSLEELLDLVGRLLQDKASQE